MIKDNVDLLPQVSLNTEPEILIESEATVANINLSLNAPPPEEGVTVTVLAPEILEFDLTSLEVTGGEIIVPPVASDLFGFTIKLTQQNASVSFVVADDGEAEGLEEVTFTLVEEPDFIEPTYQVNPKANSDTFTIADTPDLVPDPGEEPNHIGKVIFGTPGKDFINVFGSNNLIFAGDSNDLINASISEGGNHIYAGNGDDILILGMSDQLVGGKGDDKFFATFGGDNIITGGVGADQFWIATAEIPDKANIITDFTNGEDVLGIAGLGLSFEDLSITQQKNDTLIAGKGSDLAILQGIAADSLSSGNFFFA